jgi:hypothetical protein
MLKFRVRRGVAAHLPTLEEGEWGLTTDTHEVYMGTSDGNIKIGTYTDVSSSVAAHAAAATAHAVTQIFGAESTTGAQAKADAAQDAAALDATSKVDAHAAASPAHAVAQIAGAASETWVTTNYYDKTTSDSRYQLAGEVGMSPIVAAIIFGG